MKNHLEKIKDKKVLITGGLGFVGHNLAKTLCDDYGCEVTVVDDCSNSSTRVLDGYLEGKINFRQLSVLDTTEFLPLIKENNFIFHLACKQISASGSEPVLDLEVNALSTLQMLEYIRNTELPLLERFIYTSSCSVYGSSTRLPLQESGPTNVLSNYASTKLLGENYTMIYNRNYDIPTSCVRYSNVYGYGQSPTNPYCGVLGKFVHNALVGKPLTIIGDGEQTRDYTFITDAVQATILSAVHPKALGDVFNVGTNVETSVNDLAKTISDIVPDTDNTFLPERDIDNIRRRVIDIEKIHQRLGWTPLISVKRGIKETIGWYENFISKV